MYTHISKCKNDIITFVHTHTHTQRSLPPKKEKEGNKKKRQTDKQIKDQATETGYNGDSNF
jgi:hypothetical protein